MAIYKTPPSDFSAAPVSSTSIRLSWQNQSLYYAVKVYRNGTFLIQLDGEDTSYLDTGLSPNTQYYYHVSVVYYDLTESGLVGPSYATTYPTLSPPLNLAGQAFGSFIDLTWQPVSLYANAIEIWRDSGSGYSLLTSVWANQDFYRDATANTPGTYKYKTRAKVGAEYSGYSDEITVVQYGGPNAPTTGQQVAAFSDAVIISWQAPSAGAPVDGYVVYDSSDTEIVSLPATITSAYLDGLNPSTQYTFKVKAKNGAGLSSALTVQATTGDWYSEKKIDYLARNSRVRPVFGFLIDTGSTIYAWTSSYHSAFDSYVQYPNFLRVENFSYKTVIQPPYQAGLIGGSGEVSIFNCLNNQAGFFDSLLNSVDFLGKKCRLLFGDESFGSINNFIPFNGGIISGIKIEKEIITFTFSDPFSLLEQDIELPKNSDDDYVPILYGYSEIKGYIANPEQRKIKFVSHAVYDVLSVKKNGVQIDGSHWRKNLADGSIVFDSTITIDEKDEFIAHVGGKRNNANEIIYSAKDILADLLGDNLSLFDAAYFSLLKNSGNLIVEINQPQPVIELIKRIITTIMAGVYVAGDRARIVPWQTRETGISFSDYEIQKCRTERDAAYQIRQASVRYSTSSDVPAENEISQIFTTVSVGEKIELEIFGDMTAAQAVLGFLQQNGSKTKIEIDLPFLSVALRPLELINTPSGTIQIESVENNLVANTSVIIGVKQ